MKKSFSQLLSGYRAFREQFAHGEMAILQHLAQYGQQPTFMIVACCDSRVDPAVIFQCAPGDLFVVRNVANIIPPYQGDDTHLGTCAALEFGVCELKVKHLIILGHSQCGGIQAALNPEPANNEFIHKWVSLIAGDKSLISPDEFAKKRLHASYDNCLTFPWITDKVKVGELQIHRCFFDIASGMVEIFEPENKQFVYFEDLQLP